MENELRGLLTNDASLLRPAAEEGFAANVGAESGAWSDLRQLFIISGLKLFEEIKEPGEVGFW